MLDPITITLAGNAYTIQQLTIGQQCDLGVGVVLPQSEDPQENVRRAFQRNMSIIAAALAEDHPTLTKDALFKMRITPQERIAAVDAILKFAGLVQTVKPGEAAEGEAPAAAAAA
jgi:hypothetical protein